MIAPVGADDPRQVGARRTRRQGRQRATRRTPERERTDVSQRTRAHGLRLRFRAWSTGGGTSSTRRTATCGPPGRRPCGRRSTSTASRRCSRSTARRARPGSSISACGDGRISVALAVRGHHVTGLDYSASKLGAARDRAAQFDAQVELVEADVRDAHRHVTRRRRRAVLVHVVRLLRRHRRRPGGAGERPRHRWRPAACCCSRRSTATRSPRSTPTCRRSACTRSGPTASCCASCGSTRSADAPASTSASSARTAPPRTAQFSLRVYSATELVALCAAAGLTLEAVYGGPGATPFSVSTRLLVVARRTA